MKANIVQQLHDSYGRFTVAACANSLAQDQLQHVSMHCLQVQASYTLSAYLGMHISQMQAVHL